MNTAMGKYIARVNAVRSLLCVGLDSEWERVPTRFQNDPLPQFAFNRWIIEQTHPYVCAYKPNMAFYEAQGAVGWQALAETMRYLHSEHPNILTICDAKRGDIGSTSAAYAHAIFDELGFDAVTLNPYLGGEALRPFLERPDKISIILCRTSNPQSGELQDLEIGQHKLWQVVAQKVAQDWNQRGNCMLVMGATYPQELAQVRQLVGDMPFLVPGVGSQGGDLNEVLRVGLNRQGHGLIINLSRTILWADSPQRAAAEVASVMADKLMKTMQP